MIYFDIIAITVHKQSGLCMLSIKIGEDVPIENEIAYNDQWWIQDFEKGFAIDETQARPYTK